MLDWSKELYILELLEKNICRDDKGRFAPCGGVDFYYVGKDIGYHGERYEIVGYRERLEATGYLVDVYMRKLPKFAGDTKRFSRFKKKLFTIYRATAKRMFGEKLGDTCSACGSKGKLNIHHKKHIFANDLDDLILLCESCHKEYHKKNRPVYRWHSYEEGGEAFWAY